jgi:molecular chaperone GrpE
MTDQDKQKETKDKKASPKENSASLKKKLEELQDKYLRTAAEFENFRRRSISEKSDWIKNANQRLVLELCDVLDNFERALHPDIEKNRQSFEKGIELIFQQLANLLKKEGVEKIDALGEEFDPNIHEALAHIPSEMEENKIAAVIQNGYLMNKKVIRPARVAVSNGETISEQKVESNNKEDKK